MVAASNRNVVAAKGNNVQLVPKDRLLDLKDRKRGMNGGLRGKERVEEFDNLLIFPMYSKKNYTI
ncbi:hypothetical protein Pyn_19520 [Prunus yedoensis var. nudiflora]|uniref:Uncharacterized protein n=1 Tax=Prunus yedoensis var. nudiflora TaxID=2094558 RepID=A0A314UEM4_PRUYE|nr:hypothetical protein Pyn_19520 [Prunus yedoensis var. nudiflora]